MIKKQFLTLAIAGLIGGGLAFGMGTLAASKFNSTTYGYERNAENSADNYFASNNGASAQMTLPDLTAAAQRGVNAVVNIEAVKKVSTPSGSMNPFEFFFGIPQSESQPREQRSGGSGVIISKDGYIVSNNHVVEQASELKVTLHDGSNHTAKVIGADPATDIALIKIDVPQELDILEFGDSESLKVGEWVLAVGNPFGLTSTVTAGIVSAQGRSLGVIPSQMGIESFIQTDAAVNPGNSGGALMNIEGKLIGINTVIKSPTGSYAGYSFAVPSSIVRKVVSDIREWGLVQRAVLGIAGQEISAEWLEKFSKETGVKERGGIYIGQITEGGAAEAAGIKKGDVITHINDKSINTFSQLQELIAKHRPNDVVKVSIKRDSDVKHFNVTLRNRSGKAALVSKDDVDLFNVLGAKFREISDKQKKELRIPGGIQVTSVESNGLLNKSRVKAGYIITEINGVTISTISDLNKITDKVRSIDGVYPNGQIASYSIVSE